MNPFEPNTPDQPVRVIVRRILWRALLLLAAGIGLSCLLLLVWLFTLAYR